MHTQGVAPFCSDRLLMEMQFHDLHHLVMKMKQLLMKKHFQHFHHVFSDAYVAARHKAPHLHFQRSEQVAGHKKLKPNKPKDYLVEKTCPKRLFVPYKRQFFKI